MGSSGRRSLIIGLIVGVVLGILLGMVLFWVVWPVKWTDANTYDLSPEAKARYIALVADSYKLDRNLARVDDYLEGWTDEEMVQAANEAVRMYEEAGLLRAQDVKDLAQAMGLNLSSEAAEPPAEEGPGLVERLRVPCLVFFFVLLILVLGWIGLRVALRQRAKEPRPVKTRDAVPPAPVPPPPAPSADEWEGTTQPPLGHFFTTYQLGEDTYDESFSIETPMNEFLGECGVGISETVGEGDPDKVTAFEVWLFDKSDIRTVTKVLMSEHAYQDDDLRAKLASKGDAVLAQPGSPFTLETSGLQVRVDVTELVYGDEELPPNSFFSRLTVELVATAKAAEPDNLAYS
jgi:hypothetical protein